jgi:anti-sigma factor RsiW
MLNCRQVAARLSANLDGELSARERLTLRLHLLMCVHCRRLDRHLRDLVTAMRSRSWRDSVDANFIDATVERMIRASGTARD